MTSYQESKVAIVTGGSSGIGRATAIELAQAGWRVCVTGRRETELQETVKAIQEGEAEAIHVAGDITQEDVVARVFKETTSRWRRIDLVFINAGISPPSVPLADQKLTDFISTVNVNLIASYLCARESFRYMSTQSPQGGRIVLNGSISAHTPRPHSEGYTSTKHAITGLSKTLSLDGRQFDIAVTQIDIGNAASEMGLKAKSGQGLLQADGEYRQEDVMDLTYAAKEVVHAANLPLGVNVANVIIQATKMPSYVGRG
ncbi:unnamed protein product [Sympodiomycopsis kandeliae]